MSPKNMSVDVRRMEPTSSGSLRSPGRAVGLVPPQARPTSGIPQPLGELPPEGAEKPPINKKNEIRRGTPELPAKLETGSDALSLPRSMERLGGRGSTPKR